MGLFYTASPKELLNIRNKIVMDFGLPALYRNGFQKSPYSTAWFGRTEGVGYSYELCRLRNNGELEVITIYIVRRDRWIQVHLNIFKLQPTPDSMKQLDGVDGLQFGLLVNSKTMMRLKSDDIKGPPILSYDFMFRNHKLKSYYTRSGLDRRASQLSKIIEGDLNKIEYYVIRWHELHNALTTTWEGVPVKIGSPHSAKFNADDNSSK